ncbi:MAG: 4-phosphoerythronate dehydrogenase [Bacteroidales bacterium]
MKFVADDKIPFLKGVLEKYAEVHYLPGNAISNIHLKDADALLTRSITQCNKELLSNTSVKLIATATIGDDHIDKDYCQKNNITWASAKGCNAAAVEQYFTAGLLALASKHDIDLKGKTIGIIGVGNVGTKIQQVSKLLGLMVLANDPPRERSEGKAGFASLAEIQKQADIISLHTPLNHEGIDKSFHLMDQDFFDGLQKAVIFINTSRGAVVNTSALKNAINNGKVSHAILDVWENEPEIDQELLQMAAIATPHIAGYTLEGKANGTTMIVQEIAKFFNLDLKNWKAEVPASKTILTYNWEGLTEREILQEVFSRVYPILQDDKKLRANPDKFEFLRRAYNYRRENNTYVLNREGLPEQLQQILAQLGFNFNEIITNK